MKFPTGGSGQEFEKLSAGTHVSSCISIVDVGVQPGNPKFAGLVGKDGKPDQRGLPCPTVFLRFEVPAERVTYTKNGEEVEGPMTIWWNGRASMNEKANLRKAVSALVGKTLTDQEAEEFDIEKVLGKSCMITVVHSEDGKYANVKNFMALPKGTKGPKAENPLVLYSTENDSSYDVLPKFLKDKIDGQIVAGSASTNANGGSGPAKTTQQRGPSNPEDAFADGEADRQAQRRSASGRPLDDFEDAEIPL